MHWPFTLYLSFYCEQFALLLNEQTSRQGIEKKCRNCQKSWMEKRQTQQKMAYSSTLEGFMGHGKLNWCLFLLLSAFCHPGCQNGGSCVAPFKCDCPPGVTGAFCQDCKWKRMNVPSEVKPGKRKKANFPKVAKKHEISVTLCKIRFSFLPALFSRSLLEVSLLP